jgi:hypothetical protein
MGMWPITISITQGNFDWVIKPKDYTTGWDNLSSSGSGISRKTHCGIYELFVI